ncbi:hypothetical protein JCM1841_000748 [Sporobolomyces salmonicolor]
MTIVFSTWGGRQIEGVLPMIALLVHHLKSLINDSKSVPALHNAIILGLEKLFDYYGKAGDCPSYAAAICVVDTCADPATSNARSGPSNGSTMQSTLLKPENTSTPKSSSSFELLDEDDEDNIDLDLDNIVCNFATTKHVHDNDAGQPISAIDY